MSINKVSTSVGNFLFSSAEADFWKSAKLCSTAYKSQLLMLKEEEIYNIFLDEYIKWCNVESASADCDGGIRIGLYRNSASSNWYWSDGTVFNYQDYKYLPTWHDYGYGCRSTLIKFDNNGGTYTKDSERELKK